MDDTVLVNSYEINGIDYIVMNEVTYNDIKYVYLSNELDEKDSMVRKLINEELVPLDSETELLSVIKLISKK